jgi:uncharacterized Tic20 family protein
MVYIGLVLTSFGFFLPAFIAWKKKKWLDAQVSAVLAMTSVFYHGSLHPLAHQIDLGVAHSVGALSVVRGLHYAYTSRKRIDFVLLFGTFASIGVYWKKSRIVIDDSSKIWHMVFHIMCESTWICHALLR